MRRMFAGAVAGMAVVGLVGAGGPAQAAFPGTNGRIVFDTAFSHRPQIFTIRPDGTGLRQLTRVAKGHAASSPEVSPDGTRIVFTIDGQIWVMNANGGAVKRLTDPNLEANSPDWSPDGRHILFGTNCDRPRSQIWVMNADGSGPHPLTHMPPRGDAPVANYSPDGRRIVLLTNLNQLVHPTRCCWDLYVMNPDGSHLHLITTRDAGVTSPDWGPSPR